MNIPETIVIGVVSGIITSALIYLLILIFNHIVLPWYRGFIYCGVDIEGKWEEALDFNNGNTQISTYELIQKANDVSGKVTIVKSTNGQITKTEMFSLKGLVKDRFFTATQTPIDKKRLGITTILLEVIGDGRKMQGSTTWYDSRAANITSINCEWQRK